MNDHHLLPTTIATRAAPRVHPLMGQRRLHERIPLLAWGRHHVFNQIQLRHHMIRESTGFGPDKGALLLQTSKFIRHFKTQI